MKCFNHVEKDAQATCSSCAKSLCRECFEKYPSHYCDDCEKKSVQGKKDNIKLSLSEISNGYRKKIKEAAILVALLVVAIIGFPVFVMIGQKGWYHLIWIIPLLSLFAYAMQYARALHDWYYASQNLVWHKDIQTLNIQLVIISIIIVALSPVVVPLIIAVLYFKLKKNEEILHKEQK